MRKAAIVLVLGMAVLILAAADPQPPASSTQGESRAPVSVAGQPDAGFVHWLQDNTEGGICRYEEADAFSAAQLKPGGGQSCGGNICGFFQYCCNPSCGTCVYYGMSCTQQSCN